MSEPFLIETLAAIPVSPKAGAQTLRVELQFWPDRPAAPILSLRRYIPSWKPGETCLYPTKAGWTAEASPAFLDALLEAITAAKAKVLEHQAGEALYEDFVTHDTHRPAAVAALARPPVYPNAADLIPSNRPDPGPKDPK
jgi:hypothetical protein